MARGKRYPAAARLLALLKAAGFEVERCAPPAPAPSEYELRTEREAEAIALEPKQTRLTSWYRLPLPSRSLTVQHSTGISERSASSTAVARMREMAALNEGD